MRYGSQSTGIPEQWQLYVHHRQKEYAYSMKQRVQPRLVGKKKVIFILYSKHFHKLHGKKCETFFSGYKPVSRHCLFLMSCLFCTCLQMGQV